MEKKTILLLVFPILFSGMISCKKKEYWPKKSEKVVTPLNKRLDLNFSENFYYGSVEKMFSSPTREDLWILRRIQEKEDSSSTYDQIEQRNLQGSSLVYKHEEGGVLLDFFVQWKTSASKDPMIFTLDKKFFKKISPYQELALGDETCPIEKGQIMGDEGRIYLNVLSCGKNIFYSLRGLEKDQVLQVEEELILDYFAHPSSLDFSQIFLDSSHPEEVLIAYNKHQEQSIHFTQLQLKEQEDRPRVRSYSLNNKTSFIPLRFTYKNKQLYMAGSKLSSATEYNDFNLYLVQIDMDLLKIKFQQEYPISNLDDFPRDIKILQNNTLALCGLSHYRRLDPQKTGEGFFLHLDSQGKVLSSKLYGQSQGLDTCNTLTEYKDSIIYWGGMSGSHLPFVQYFLY